MLELTLTLVFMLATIAANGRRCSAYSHRSLFASTGGGDANSVTADLPLRTIQRGVDELNFGDTLSIAGGVSRENVALSR